MRTQGDQIASFLFRDRDFYMNFAKLPSIVRHMNTTAGVIQRTPTSLHLMIVLILIIHLTDRYCCQPCAHTLPGMGTNNEDISVCVHIPCRKSTDIVP